MSAEHVHSLQEWANEFVRNGDEGAGVRLNRAVEFISKSFEVQTHEVAILGLTPDEEALRFLAPDNLRTSGQIPLSSAYSLAARTVRERRPQVVNQFAKMPHATVFEAVPHGKGRRTEQIQKIMSSPIVFEGQVIGAVQVSRKGKSPTDAGPNFTSTHLDELKMISDALAPCILRCLKK
jgi:GAF domain-containing protein